MLDSFNTGGNQSVTVCAGTSTPIKNINIWYGTSGNIFNLTNGNVISAFFKNGTVYNYTNSSVLGGGFVNVGNKTGASCVNFTLNGTTAPFTNKTTMINVTKENNTEFFAATDANKTVLTINYVAVEAQSAANASLTSVVLMNYNNRTKGFVDDFPEISDASGYWAQHCVGVVVNGACNNVTASTTPNQCVVHGTNEFGGFEDAGAEACAFNSTLSNVTFLVFDFISSNTTIQNATIAVSATSAPVLQARLTTRTAISFVQPFSFQRGNSETGPTFVNVTQINISDYADPTNTPIFTQTVQNEGPPFFLDPNKLYKVYVNIQNTGTFSYPFLLPSAGMAGLMVSVPNSNENEFTTFVGKVVNESGNVMPNAVVYAQFNRFSGDSFGINFMNSSVTDSNGRFQVRVPTTKEATDSFGTFSDPVYQFYIVSNDTSSGGVIKYFPTVDNNNERGFFAQGTTTALPPLTLKAGGEVRVNVTLNNLPLMFTDLRRFKTVGKGVTTESSTGKFVMTSIFDQVTLPSTMSVQLLSPTNQTVTERIVVSIFGKNQSLFDSFEGGLQPVRGACINNTAAVLQGQATDIQCNLTTPGNLNLTVRTCTDVPFNTQCTDERPSDFAFWFESTLIGYNGSNTSTPLLYLDPSNALLQQLVGFGRGTGTNLTIPLPPGNYTFELSPSFEFSRFGGVYNSSHIVITAGGTTNLKLVRSERWEIRPQFNPSLTLSSSNSLNVTIADSKGTSLTGTNVTLLGKMLYPNRSVASTTQIIFQYDSGRGVFYNTTIRPGTDLGLTAGKYWLQLNATNTSNVSAQGNTTYNSLIRYSTLQLMPVTLSDFQVGLDLGGSTFGPGSTVIGKIFAYNTSVNPPVGVNSTGTVTPGNVTVEVVDPNGGRQTITVAAGNITDGQGNVSITMPTTIGYYSIITTVKTDSGQNACANCQPIGLVGLSENWLQISSMSVKATTDKFSYRPTDSVNVKVQVLNGTTGAPVTDAFVEIAVDSSNTPATGTTSSLDGAVSIRLSPSTYGTNGQWSFGFHNLKIKISKDTGSDVIKLETYSGFEVRGLDAFVQPDRPSYTTSDTVTINVFFPPDASIRSVSAVLDGNSTKNYTVSQQRTDHWQLNLGTQTAGRHSVEITATDNSGNKQKFFTGFLVTDSTLQVSTNKFSYAVNDVMNVSVKVTTPNGTSLPNKNVIATLFKAQSPNDIQVAKLTGVTNASGQLTINMTASQAGPGYVRVEVDSQQVFVGIQVSAINATLRSSQGGATVNSYDAVAGETVALYITALSGTTPVRDNSVVTARVWAFGNPIDLPSNNTTTGNATIYFQVPSNAPAQTYGLDVKVIESITGDVGFAPPATLIIKGGTALKMTVSADRSFFEPYQQGEPATYTASMKYPNGTAVSGYNVTFEVGSDSSRPETKGTANTDSAGNAVLRTIAPTTDGEYFIHAYATNSSDVQAYSGFVVSSLGVAVTADKSNYTAGENVTLNFTVTNRTSGSRVNATSVFIFTFNRNTGESQTFFDPSGKVQPYTTNVTLPNDSTAIGQYPIGVEAFVNRSRGFGHVLVDVVNKTLGTTPLNLTLPSSITANVSFTVNISSASAGNATLSVFSPAAERIAYENTSVRITAPASGPNATVTITLNESGAYVFTVFLQGVGTKSVSAYVAPSTTVGSSVEVWTGPNPTQNATTFTTSQDVYVVSNKANATATIMTVNSTTNSTLKYSVPLTLTSGSNFYGIFENDNLASGNNYHVRLDTSTSSGIATTMFRVS